MYAQCEAYLACSIEEVRITNCWLSRISYLSIEYRRLARKHCRVKRQSVTRDEVQRSWSRLGAIKECDKKFLQKNSDDNLRFIRCLVGSCLFQSASLSNRTALVQALEGFSKHHTVRIYLVSSWSSSRGNYISSVHRISYSSWLVNFGVDTFSLVPAQHTWNFQQPLGAE